MGKEQELLQAVRQQNFPVVIKIVQKNTKTKSFLGSGKQKRINFNFQDCEGMAACHHAAVAGNTQMLTTLLENGANVDLQDNRGLRPIHFACAHGRTESVHLLLRWGSTPNAGAADGCTPLHLACQNGHVDVVKLLIYNHGDVNIRSHEGRTPFDLACEYGRFLVVDLLLSSNLVQHQLHSRPVDPAVPEQFTCLHLSAQNGHTEVLRLLIKQPGVDINRRMPRGTCLHEAAAGGHFHTAKMLLENGIDPHKTNSYGQISSEVVPPGAPNSKELKQMLQEACFAVRAEAVRDYCDLRNQNSIAFRVGESVTVLEQCSEGMWKGYVTQEGMARTGYFPASAVRLLTSTSLDRQPDAGVDCTFGPDERFPPPPSPGAVCSPTGPGDTPPPLPPPPHYASAGNPAGDVSVTASGVAPAPALLTCAGGSNRNSAASVDSGRSSAHTAGSESGRSVHGSGCYSLNHPATSQASGSSTSGMAPAVSGVRSSMQSMESGLCRQSYVSSSSSSSLGSLDHLEGGGACCSGAVDADSAYSSTGTASARSLSLLPGSAALSPCSLRTWLQEAGLGQCAEALLAAGYDLGTATRMTPEDMNAAGITNPHIRKRLKAELSRACISDGLPEFIPENVVHWVKCLNLEEYYDTLTRQGYTTVEKVMDITWEDLEDIGIKRLGHQKKIILAIERLRRLKKGSESALAAAAAAASVSGGPPRPSRFHHHHHHHHTPTLHTPPPGAVNPPNLCAPPASPSTPAPHASKLPVEDLQPPPSPRTAVVPPTVAPKPVAKIPPGCATSGTTGSLERKRQPPPPPPKRITSMKGSPSPQGGSPVRRHASPAAPRRHNYENLKTPPGANGASTLAAVVSHAERRRASLEQQHHHQQHQQHQQQQQMLPLAAVTATPQSPTPTANVVVNSPTSQHHEPPQLTTPKKQNNVSSPLATDLKLTSSEEKTSKSVAAGHLHHQGVLVSPFGTSTMRRSSAPADRRHHQGTPPHILVAAAHRARRSPEMTDDSCLGQGELSECLKSRSSSTLSVESNSLPFANENVGTIKQRSNNSSKPSLSSLDFYASLDLNVGSYTAENGTIRRKASPPMTVAEHSSSLLDSPRKCPPPVPRRRDSIDKTGEESESDPRSSQPHDQEQLDDICDMLEDLSDMLEREIAEDEQLRLA